MSILAVRQDDLAAGELAAIADEPRPGVWIQESMRDRFLGDGRALSQNETDRLIARELIDSPEPDTSLIETLRLWWYPVQMTYDMPVRHTVAEQQRGGVHSEPLVRLLAYRAWGDRDRRWGEIHRGTPIYINNAGGAVSAPCSPNSLAVGLALREPENTSGRWVIDVATGELNDVRLRIDRPYFEGTVILLPIAQQTIGPDGRCTCVNDRPCPLGRMGAEYRCTRLELQRAGVVLATVT